MMRLSGWARIFIVASGLWLVAVGAASELDRQRLLDNQAPWGLVTLRDPNTGETFGYLSKPELRELGELVLKKSKSSDAEPGDAEEAKRLLEAQPTPSFLPLRILTWSLVPVVALWILYGCFLWVRAGFRGKP